VRITRTRLGIAAVALYLLLLALLAPAGVHASPRKTVFASFVNQNATADVVFKQFREDGSGFRVVRPKN